MRPVVAVTMSMRTIDTFLGPGSALHTLPDAYGAALDQAGAIPLMVGRLRPAEAGRLVEMVDGLVLTGGPDLDPALYGQVNTASETAHRQDDDRDLALVLEARRRRTPLLAICRGLQAVNVALGGDLHQHVLSGDDPEHPALPDDWKDRNAHRHPIEPAEGSRLAAIYGVSTRGVNSLHHQGVARVAPGVVVAARTPGGSVEAIESSDPSWPMLAVQWHPEMLPSKEEAALFRAFVEDARTYRRRGGADGI